MTMYKKADKIIMVLVASIIINAKDEDALNKAIVNSIDVKA